MDSLGLASKREFENDEVEMLAERNQVLGCCRFV